jgi:hypothetical protein
MRMTSSSKAQGIYFYFILLTIIIRLYVPSLQWHNVLARKGPREVWRFLFLFFTLLYIRRARRRLPPPFRCNNGCLSLDNEHGIFQPSRTSFSTTHRFATQTRNWQFLELPVNLFRHLDAYIWVTVILNHHRYPY